MIKLIDLKKENSLSKEVILNSISKIIEKNDFILGDHVNNFESLFADFVGADNAIGVNSGTSALELALASLNLNKDDEVLVPTLSFVSTALAPIRAGVKIVFVDIDPITYTISIDDLAKKITKKTKVIIPVHLYGQHSHMEEILKISKDKNIHIIEDAAQAHGACSIINGEEKQSGTIGDLGCFSFYPSKNLGAFGDAGIITTNNSKLIKKLKILRNYGQSHKNVHEELGYNMRLDSIQAIILKEKLKFLTELNKKRINNANIYSTNLKNSNISTPFIEKGNTHVFHQYIIEHKKRDKLAKHLEKYKIETAIHYPTPIHLQPCFSYLGHKKGDFPNAERACNRILSIPIHPFLSENDIDKVISSIKDFNE